MYQFTEGFNRNQHFWFDKKLIENMNWAMLPKSSKAIYPVIASYCNKHGKSFPGEHTIAALSGRTEKVVRQGIDGLTEFPGFKFEYYTTKRGRRAKRYLLSFPQKEKGRSFPFHKNIIEGGNWSQLKPTAAALYPVMRYFGYYDQDETDDDSDVFVSFPNRECDFCCAESSILAKYAGIARSSITKALNNLVESSLIAESNPRVNGWKVFLHPPSYFKRDYLNENIMSGRCAQA
jgi:hypothetical protein